MRARSPLIFGCILFSFFSSMAHAEEEENTTKIPMEFIRDFMQPLGMPVVSSFHGMRESFFFNFKVKNPSFFESIGNFFLTPSRYLFAGKTVRVTNPETVDYEVFQSHHYEKMHWFKSLFCIAALPFSEVLGTTFKGLAYLSPKVRRKHRAIKRALTSSLIKSNLDKYRQYGLEAFHCDEFIPCQGHKRPSSLTKKQKIEIQALKEIIALLDEHNIIYWIDCGTCLGAYRYGGFIPWDWDIDLSILLPDHENVKKILSHLDPKKYTVQDWSSYSNPNSFLKIYVKKTKNFIDLYHYELDEENKTLAYFFTYLNSPFPKSWKKDELKCLKPVKYEEVFPLKKATFDNLTVWAPNNVVSFLQSKFGENLDPAMIWDEETKSYKRVVDHPYFQD